MTTRFVREWKSRINGSISPAFFISDKCDIYWERKDNGIFDIGVIPEAGFGFPKIKAVTNDFGDLVQVY